MLSPSPPRVSPPLGRRLGEFQRRDFFAFAKRLDARRFARRRRQEIERGEDTSIVQDEKRGRPRGGPAHRHHLPRRDPVPSTNRRRRRRRVQRRRTVLPRGEKRARKRRVEMQRHHGRHTAAADARARVQKITRDERPGGRGGAVPRAAEDATVVARDEKFSRRCPPRSRQRRVSRDNAARESPRSAAAAAVRNVTRGRDESNARSES